MCSWESIKPRAPNLTCGLKMSFITKKKPSHDHKRWVEMTCGFFGNTLLGNYKTSALQAMISCIERENKSVLKCIKQ